jgi:hypothetical protein
MRLILACVALTFLAQPVRAIEVSSFEPLLVAGKWSEAETQLTAAVAADAKDDNARFALGTVQALQAFEGLVQGLYRYGLDPEWRTSLPMIRLPIPENPKPTPLTNDDFRKLVSDFVAQLAKAEATLAPIKSPDVKIPLAIGTYRIDVDGDGIASDSESFWGIFGATIGAPIGEEDAQGFVIAFDAGDVNWLRGYCHLLQAFCEAYLAHDTQDMHDHAAQFFFPTAEVKYPVTLAPPGDMWNSIADAIAFIHLIRLPVSEPERLKASHAHLLEVIAQSRLSWAAIAAETDDDREWIPGEEQQNVAIPGARVSGRMVEGWHDALDEAELILNGKKLIPYWRVGDNRDLNLKRVFFEPREFDLVMWVQGSAAVPYLEDGPSTSAETWRQLQRLFGGQLGLFAIWFN